MLLAVIFALAAVLHVGLCIASAVEYVPRANPFAWFVDFVNKTLDPLPEYPPLIIQLTDWVPRCDYIPPAMLYGGRGRQVIHWAENGTILSIDEW
jgi:hypothetical protein